MVPYHQSRRAGPQGPAYRSSHLRPDSEASMAESIDAYAPEIRAFAAGAFVDCWLYNSYPFVQAQYSQSSTVPSPPSLLKTPASGKFESNACQQFQNLMSANVVGNEMSYPTSAQAKKHGHWATNRGRRNLSSNVVFPRRKAGQLQREKPPVMITELIQRYSELPQQTAAKHLGICVTALKKACRRVGIPRWPFRDQRYTNQPCQIETMQLSPKSRSKKARDAEPVLPTKGISHTESPRCVDAFCPMDQINMQSSRTEKVSVEEAIPTEIDSFEAFSVGKDGEKYKLWDTNSNVTNGISLATGEQFLSDELDRSTLEVFGNNFNNESFRVFGDDFETNCQHFNFTSQSRPWEGSWSNQS
eukprot:750463-Hanusia_phi.AAC.4